MVGLSDINSMVSGLQSSIDAALKRVQQQAQKAGAGDPPAGSVKEYEQDTRKSALNIAATATDMGTLVKDKSRLNSFSILGKNDPVDFYKFKVTNKGEMALGRVGDDGVRVQLMDKTGKIIADSDKTSGSAYDAYQKLTAGTLTVDSGNYTFRVSRDKGVPPTQEKQYALQLRMGTYSEDYDTYAKQPATASGTSQMPSYVQTLQAMLNGNTSGFGLGNNAASALLSSYSGRGSLINALF